MNWKIKKTGKKLGLFRSGNYVFGEYCGANIFLFDESERRFLRIKTGRSLDDQIIESLKENYCCSRFNYEKESGYFDIVIYSKRERVVELIDEIISNCRLEKITLLNNCDLCGAANSNYYKYRNMPHILCPVCFDTEQRKIKREKNEFENKSNNYLRGIMGALAYSLLGIMLQTILLYSFSYWGSIPFMFYSAFIYILAVILGYNKFHGKQTKFSGFLIMILFLIVIVGGTLISLRIYHLFIDPYEKFIFTDWIKMDKWGMLDFSIHWIPFIPVIPAGIYSWIKKWKFNFFSAAQRL